MEPYSSNYQTLVAKLILSRLAVEDFSLRNLTLQDDSLKTTNVKSIPVTQPSLCEAQSQQETSPPNIYRAPSQLYTGSSLVRGKPLA